MKHYMILAILIIVFLSGCVTQQDQTTVSGVGLSGTLSPDVKQAKSSSPVTFILSIKNLASESVNDISTQLLNLTDWRVENGLQHLDQILPNDIYKFSWIAYAPSTPNRTFTLYTDIFYKTETNANLKLRVYNNNYLNGLKSDERESIKGKSALLSLNLSKSTPVTVKLSLQQPFILTDYSENFPFVIEIKNVGLGKAYSDAAGYPVGDSLENYVRFSFTSNSTVMCDYDNDLLVGLINGSKSVVCKLSVTQDQISSYADFSVDFKIKYSYLDKAYAKIGVV